MIFVTKVEFYGEERIAEVEWEPVDGEVCVQEVILTLIIEHDWRPDGRYDKWLERHQMDVKSILSDEQISELAKEIKTEARNRRDEYEPC
jgi:hypothetical protein